MNAIHIYDWADAPHSLRESVKDLIPQGYSPQWLAYAERRSKSPTYLLAFVTKAFIESMAQGWNRVFMQETTNGEVRVGCTKPVR